jgi:hypothetical protein
MSLPLPTYYIDIGTGQMLAGLGGFPVGNLAFTSSDVLALPIGFCDGSTDKGDLVTGTGTATITISVKAAPGGTLLAQSAGYTYATPIATVVMSLFTSELAAYFTANVPGSSAQFYMEVKVAAASGGNVRSYWFGSITILRSVSGGTTPTGYIPGSTVPSFTTQAELLAIATVGSVLYVLLTGTINGALVTVQLIASTNTTGGGYYRPNDYNASTNAVAWQQLV